MPITLNGTTGEVFPSWTTAGRPASPVAGQTGFNTTLGTLEVYGGSEWEPLVTTNDSGTVTPTMLSQKLTQMTVQNASGTSVSFTSIPSWAKRVTVMFSNVSLSGTAHLLIQIGNGGVPNTSSYTANTTALANAAVTNSSSSAGFPVFLGVATYAVYGAVTLVNITGNSWVASGTVYNATTTLYSATVAGIGTLSGTLDMLRVVSANGTDTFDAGTINIMYEG